MHLSDHLCRLLLIASLSSVSCQRGAPIIGGRVPAEPAASMSPTVSSYPRARWRLAAPEELDQVILWVSQILIRHDQSDPDPAFQPADWHSESPRPKRSRVEALVLARELREQASKDPAHFAALASSHSEDVATRSQAGSLGGIRASQLLLWPTVLDALAATPIGHVSEVVETSYGFHILQRRAPPPESTVSGAHIVIGHQAAGWVRILGRGEAPLRSRDEALALANQLYEQAKRKPPEFSALVAQYSEHRDAAHGGDMGTWSIREPSFYPRELEVLAGLAVGETAPPLDSPVGFQIIQRTPNRARGRFAVDEIRLFFDPARSAPDPTSPALVLEQASQLSAALRADPSRFYDIRKDLCCRYSEQWEEGRGSPTLTDALSRLQLGQITSEPIQTELSYVIAKRLDPPKRWPASVRFDLPQPSAPDVTAWLQAHDDTAFRDELGRLGEEVLNQVALSESEARQVRDLHREPGRFDRLGSPDLRSAAFQQLLERVQHVLEPDAYACYLALLDAHFTTLVLGGR